MPRKARLAALHTLLLGMAVTFAGCDRRGPPKSVMPLPRSGVPPITLSRETTFITEPLTPEGLPDYVPYINEVYGEGVTPDSNAAGILAPALGTRLDDETLTTIGVDPQTIDSWPQLIGSVLRSDFEEYLDSIEKTGSACARRELRDTFVDERYTLEVDGPGSPEDFTVVSEWLDANEASMSAIAEASERRHWWIPFTQGKNLPHQPIPSLLAQRTASLAFQARAMLALGSAHWDDAVDDVLVGYRLSALTRQGGTLIEALIAGGQQDFASSALAHVASSPSLRPAAARELLPKVQNAIDTPFDYGKERFFNLATLVWMWQVGDAAKWNEILEPEQFPTRDLPDGLYRIPASAVDWDEALRIVNRAHDRTDDARSYHGPQELGWTSRLEEPRLSEFVERAVNDELGARLQLTEAVVAGAELIPETWPVRFRISRNESRARALATLALAVYRAEHGAWPSRLDELAPDYIKDVPRTEGYVFSYRASGNEIALVASPEKPNQTGHYGYCWDGTDGLHVTVDGSAHRIVDGRCHSEREARTPAQTRLGWLVAGFLGLMSAGVIARRAKMERAQVAVVLTLAWTLGLLMIFLRTFEGPVTTFAQTEASELLALTISPLTIFAGGLGALTGASLLVALERHSSPWVVGALGAALTLTVVACHPVRYVKLLGCIACLATTFLYLSTRFSKDQWCWKVAAGLLAGVTLAFPLLITAARLEVSVGIAGAVLCAVLSAGFLLSIRIDSPLKRESVVFAIGALFALVAMTWLVGPVNRAQLLMIMCVAPVVWMSSPSGGTVVRRH